MKRRRQGNARFVVEGTYHGSSNIPPRLWEAFRSKLRREGHTISEFLRRCLAAYTEGWLPFPGPPKRTWYETAEQRFKEGNRWGREIEVDEEWARLELGGEAGK